MIKRIVLSLSFATIISCKSPKQPVQEKILDIRGIWTSGETENATFQIDEDSIFYVDALKKYKYHLEGDTLLIKFDDRDYSCKIIKADKDSLILINNDRTRTAFWRFND